jgi:hypothetical protein
VPPAQVPETLAASTSPHPTSNRRVSATWTTTTWRISLSSSRAPDLPRPVARAVKTTRPRLCMVGARAESAASSQPEKVSFRGFGCCMQGWYYHCIGLTPEGPPLGSGNTHNLLSLLVRRPLQLKIFLGRQVFPLNILLRRRSPAILIGRLVGSWVIDSLCDQRRWLSRFQRQIRRYVPQLTFSFPIRSVLSIFVRFLTEVDLF